MAFKASITTEALLELNHCGGAGGGSECNPLELRELLALLVAYRNYGPIALSGEFDAKTIVRIGSWERGDIYELTLSTFRVVLTVNTFDYELIVRKLKSR